MTTTRARRRVDVDDDDDDIESGLRELGTENPGCQQGEVPNAFLRRGRRRQRRQQRDLSI